MRNGRRWLFSLIVMLGLGILAAGPAFALPAQPPAVLVLGPLPAPLGTAGSGPLAPSPVPVPEIDPLTVNPHAGAKVVLDVRGPSTWQRVALKAGEPISLPKAGVYWIFVKVRLDRWTKVSLKLDGSDSRTLYFDGTKVAGPVKGGGSALEAPVNAARGTHTILARVERASAQGARPKVSLTLTTTPPAGVSWELAGRDAPARFDQMRRIVRIGPLAIAQKGTLIARRLTFMGPQGQERHSRVDIIKPDGTVVAASVGDGTASPVAFSTNLKTNDLLLRQRGTNGTNLVIFDPDTRTQRTIIRNEPGLGFIHWGPGGTHLLLASARGTKAVSKHLKDPHRELALREKLPDYVPNRRLWLVEVATGARRALTEPGDWVLDDAAFVPAKRSIIYAKTVPIPQRPFFATEFHWIDLVKGTDTKVATFTAGWESRPAHLAPSLDGKEVAFLGPPDQVGAGHPDHNVYNRQIWMLDVKAGTFTRITSLKGPAYTARTELLSWNHNNNGLVAAATDASVTRIIEVLKQGGTWNVNRLDTIAEAIAEPAISPDRFVVGFVGEGRALPPEIHLLPLKSGKEAVVERPNAELAKIWKLSHPRRAPFKLNAERYIDAWWYPPTVKADSGKTPLIVYYYGGATPTTRRFNTTHQVLAANGYAVLVINPRGAIGYGQDFADDHMNDWGPKASADILKGIDAFLAKHPEIDAHRIGIYGGSFGGFMTEYLVSHTNRFAAAVAMYGISDISGYWGGGAWGYTYGDTALAGSYPWNATKLFSTHSPVYNADKIHTPLLLLHGMADRNVPTVQSKELYTALKILGRPVELVLFPNEDHGIAGSWKDWIDHRTMMLDFFDRYLRHQPEAWNARWKEVAAKSAATK